MSVQGTYLVNGVVEHANTIKNLLNQIHDEIDSAANLYDALGVAALAGFAWPNGYTEADFTSLIAVLKALPDSVVTTSSRDALYKLTSSFV